jgi:hypothetical protein
MFTDGRPATSRTCDAVLPAAGVDLVALGVQRPVWRELGVVRSSGDSLVACEQEIRATLTRAGSSGCGNLWLRACRAEGEVGGSEQVDQVGAAGGQVDSG